MTPRRRAKAIPPASLLDAELQAGHIGSLLRSIRSVREHVRTLQVAHPGSMADVGDADRVAAARHHLGAAYAELVNLRLNWTEMNGAKDVLETLERDSVEPEP
jgi:hypothetical protein